MANEKNLIPINKRTKSEQREYRKKGGQKSGEVRREKKLLRELLEEALLKKTETGRNKEYIIFEYWDNKHFEVYKFRGNLQGSGITLR